MFPCSLLLAPASSLCDLSSEAQAKSEAPQCGAKQNGRGHLLNLLAKRGRLGSGLLYQVIHNSVNYPLELAPVETVGNRIHTPPGSTLLMSNGIVASGNIIVPLDSGVFAYEALETLKTLIINLHNELGVETNVMMIILREYSSSFMDRRATGIVKKLLKIFLQENNIPQVKIFTMPFSRQVYWSQMKGMPISHYAPLSDIGRSYEEIAKELLWYEYEYV